MRKLWNRPASPVWSLSTVSESCKPNMNICTYVTAVSLQPKVMTVAVYHGTKTRENIVLGSRVLLQLLTEDLAPAVWVCGQQSGRTIDKISRLQKRYQLEECKGLFYFLTAAGYIELSITDIHEPGGDHTLVTGQVLFSRNLTDKPILTTTFLREHKYTR